MARRESEATDGEKLCALIMSMLMGTTFSTALKKIPADRNIDPGWERKAEELKRAVAENVGALVSVVTRE